MRRCEDDAVLFQTVDFGVERKGIGGFLSPLFFFSSPGTYILYGPLPAQGLIITVFSSSRNTLGNSMTRTVVVFLDFMGWYRSINQRARKLEVMTLNPILHRTKRKYSNQQALND